MKRVLICVYVSIVVGGCFKPRPCTPESVAEYIAGQAGISSLSREILVEELRLFYEEHFTPAEMPEVFSLVREAAENRGGLAEVAAGALPAIRHFILWDDSVLIPESNLWVRFEAAAEAAEYADTLITMLRDGGYPEKDLRKLGGRKGKTVLLRAFFNAANDQQRRLLIRQFESPVGRKLIRAGPDLMRRL